MSFKYFDLHIHPIFKTLFKNEGNQVSGWTNIEVPDSIFGNCFDSQSSLKMAFEKRNVNLLCIGKHAPEKNMVWNLATRLVAGMPGYENFMELSRLENLYRSITDYQQVHYEEMNRLFEAHPSNNKLKIKPLKNMSEYDPEDFNTIHAIFNVEGAHMFYERGNIDTRINEMLNIFNQYRLEHLMLYVTVAHLTPNVFANHADGNKILPNEKTWPSGHGLSTFGKQLITEIYNQKVLVDIKHMSWVSRKHLYKLREENNWKFPLIASHVALTGFKVNERMDYINKIKGIKRARKVYKVRYKKKEGIIGDTKFNPVSINLYDDDVVEVLKSKGLLGINLDKRILGASTNLWGNIKNKETEFISIEETGDWFGAIDALSPLFDDYIIYGFEGKFIPDEEDVVESEEEFHELFPKTDTSIVTERTPILHLKYFCNQILKIKQIADQNKAELKEIYVWDHICMGADFDGLISAIDCCVNIMKVGEFAKEVEDNLQNYADDAGIQLGISAAEIVERIFFKNGYEFLKRHFGS